MKLLLPFRQIALLHIHVISSSLTLELVEPGVDGVGVVVVLPVHVAALVARRHLGAVGDLLRVGQVHAVLDLPVMKIYILVK